MSVEVAGRTVARGGAQGKVTVRGLPADVDRQWFDLVPERGRGLHLADRLVKLDGAVNFRDAGGYRTAAGHWVKMGEVYRSDALDKLTAADLGKTSEAGAVAMMTEGEWFTVSGDSANGRAPPC
ncbi:tyrosine-protein phosphatase [Streptomyces sp. NPDC050085]|uniref:tyrosine-protein phosphatase n=1 Tax=Streptomyces sp. NPDC050085 TaxID=3365600 RepID=UPI0037889470